MWKSFELLLPLLEHVFALRVCWFSAHKQMVTGDFAQQGTHQEIGTQSPKLLCVIQWHLLFVPLHHTVWYMKAIFAKLEKLFISPNSRFSDVINKYFCGIFHRESIKLCLLWMNAVTTTIFFYILSKDM